MKIGAVLVLALAIASCVSLGPMLTPEMKRDPDYALYAAKCRGCHHLHSPAEHGSNQWRPILETMSRKARLSPREDLRLFAYLSRYAADAPAPAK